MIIKNIFPGVPSGRFLLWLYNLVLYLLDVDHSMNSGVNRKHKSKIISFPHKHKQKIVFS